MRLRETIKIGDLEITVKELTIREILDAASSLANTKQTLLVELRTHFETFLPLLTDITLDDITSMAPSEVAEIYEAVKRVNATFFALAEYLGLTQVLGDLQTSIVNGFSSLVVGSLKLDT